MTTLQVRKLRHRKVKAPAQGHMHCLGSKTLLGVPVAPSLCTDPRQGPSPWKAYRRHGARREPGLQQVVGEGCCFVCLPAGHAPGTERI